MVIKDLSLIERSLLIIALIFIITIAAKTTAYLISIVMMAVVTTMLATPALFWLRRKGFSDLAATIVIMGVGSLIALGFILLTALSVNTLIVDLPQYQQNLDTRLNEIAYLLAPFGLSSIITQLATPNAEQALSFCVNAVTGIAEGLVFIFFVAVMTFFMLLDLPRINTQLEGFLGKNSPFARNLSRMTGYVIDFIVVRTETNLIHGFLFGGFLGLIGVHGAILWGVLTFLLGFIPYFGLIIAAVPAIFFAWLQFGLPGAMAVIVAVCVLNLIVENPILSYLTARKFEMPALVVVISVIFWSWLLGLVGMLFAIPFTLMIFLVFHVSGDLCWINTALGVDHLFCDQQERHEDEGEKTA